MCRSKNYSFDSSTNFMPKINGGGRRNLRYNSIQIPSEKKKKKWNSAKKRNKKSRCVRTDPASGHLCLEIDSCRNSAAALPLCQLPVGCRSCYGRAREEDGRRIEYARSGIEEDIGMYEKDLWQVE